MRWKFAIVCFPALVLPYVASCPAAGAEPLPIGLVNVDRMLKAHKPLQEQLDPLKAEAKELDAKIVTNDFNLNKVAQVRGVSVLNINELANALKPVVLPGEFMRVFILKEGKEYNQGVAYLDDGTMVVVDNARKMISKTIDIVVTSVLQTTAGKMIFGRYIEPNVGPASSSGSTASGSTSSTSGADRPPDEGGRSRVRQPVSSQHT